jgi:hypothetical protein
MHRITLATIHRSVIPLLAMAAASVACTVFVGGPDFPDERIPVSVEAANSVKDQLKSAMESGLLTGTVTLQMNESQLTSLFAMRLDEQSDPFMTEPQIYLRSGQMQVFGKVQRGIFTANVSIVVALGIDASGMPTVDVISTDFGPLPAPAGLNAAIAAVVAEAYTGPLGPIATGFRLESITIADGVMTLSGRVR